MNEWSDSEAFDELRKILREDMKYSELSLDEIQRTLLSLEQFIDRHSWRFHADQLSFLRLKLLTAKYLLLGARYGHEEEGL